MRVRVDGFDMKMMQGGQNEQTSAGIAEPAEEVLTGGQENKKKKKKKKANTIAYVHPLTEPPPASEFEPYEPKDYFRYELVHQSKISNARVGKIHTPHGVVDTPGFVPVATAGALKAIEMRDVDKAANQQLLFCNTYHLLLQPGPDIVAEAGGLHEFLNRDRSKPIITDSGGFQVFSLAHGSVHDELNIKGGARTKNHAPSVMKTNEEGVTFRSYRDGKMILLTPESTIQVQKKLGADIIIPLDHLPPYHITPELLTESVYLSHRWEARSLKEHLRDKRQQAMYGVVHGGVDRELRQKSIDYLKSLPFDGYAMGGSMGKLGDEMVDLVEFVMPQLPKDKPNHLLGIADVKSILKCVKHGVDTFDSAFPSRNGRHGSLLAPNEELIQIKNTKYKNLHQPVSPYLPYTGAYLHHLMKAREPVCLQLFTHHNLCFMQDFMCDIREKIMRDEI